jgi:hypothetical protein
VILPIRSCARVGFLVGYFLTGGHVGVHGNIKSLFFYFQEGLFCTKNKCMATIDELLRPFAKSIRSKVVALNALKLRLLPHQRACILESISDDIKKCTNFISPGLSQAAQKEAERLGVDLRSLNWHDQPRFDPGRKMFQWEHILPVKSIRKKCFDQPFEKNIFKILKRNLRVAWILKIEDAELTRRGYRTDRRNLPDAYRAYKQAKIVLLPRRGK